VSSRFAKLSRDHTLSHLVVLVVLLVVAVVGGRLLALLTEERVGKSVMEGVQVSSRLRLLSAAIVWSPHAASGGVAVSSLPR